MKTKANSSPRSGGGRTHGGGRKTHTELTENWLTRGCDRATGPVPGEAARSWQAPEKRAPSQRNSIIIFLDTKSREYRFAPSNMVASSDAWLFQFKYNKTESSVSQSRWSHFKWAIVTLARCYHRSQSRIHPSPQKSLLDGSDLKCPHPLRHPSNALEWTPNLPPWLRRPLPGSQDLFLPL